MLYLIQFHDSADAPTDLRARYMAQHLAFLQGNKGAQEHNWGKYMQLYQPSAKPRGPAIGVRSRP